MVRNDGDRRRRSSVDDTSSQDSQGPDDDDNDPGDSRPPMADGSPWLFEDDNVSLLEPDVIIDENPDHTAALDLHLTESIGGDDDRDMDVSMVDTYVTAMDTTHESEDTYVTARSNIGSSEHDFPPVTPDPPASDSAGMFGISPLGQLDSNVVGVIVDCPSALRFKEQQG